ncbi:hypothetical protein NLG97_g6582 [Lecanicillium saksenae]|uniref:Uncharacterized protein n=1 Tax=Lecanicillium saksenae TaxID=468837 RepID=A0ACC1QPC2_9HYPO|nr:hypothetical protein NLG97_g6582 [Lecanicillium saksenae]
MCRADYYIRQYCCEHNAYIHRTNVEIQGCGGCGIFVGGLVRTIIYEDYPCDLCQKYMFWVPWNGMWLTVKLCQTTVKDGFVTGKETRPTRHTVAMCAELISVTPYLCHHVACEGSYMRPLNNCDGCGDIKQTSLRKEPGPPTTPCKTCCDNGSWVMHEKTWMKRRESKVWAMIEEYAQEANRSVEALMVQNPTGQRLRSAEEARDRVTTIFERQRAGEQRPREDTQATVDVQMARETRGSSEPEEGAETAQSGTGAPGQDVENQGIA